MKRSFTLLLCLALVFALSVPALADTGPKPSVHIRLENTPEGVFYGTLLSKSRSSGPYIYDPDYTPDDSRRVQYLDVWREFQRYEDPDGYYFLNELWDCSGGELAWTYYPPADFKLLLYFPDTGEFLSSGPCSRYAFDSYFRADLAAGDGTVELEVSRDFSGEALGFLVRVLITFAIELVIALAFGFRHRRTLGLIVLVNLATQTALNLTLDIFAFFRGSSLALFIVCELAVTIIEAAVFARTLPKRSKSSPSECVSYAVLANAASFIGGLIISAALPWAF